MESLRVLQYILPVVHHQLTRYHTDDSGFGLRCGLGIEGRDCVTDRLEGETLGERQSQHSSFRRRGASPRYNSR